jgi:hypothetical protein
MSGHTYKDCAAVGNRFIYRALDRAIDALLRLDAHGHVIESVTVTSGKPHIVIAPPRTPIPGARLAHRTGAHGHREIVGEVEIEGCRVEWAAPALAHAYTPASPAVRHG